MIHIEDLVIEWQDKVFSVWNGGIKYGHDYNILKAILRHHKNRNLVKSLVDSLRDKILVTNVRSWMAGAA